MTLLEFQQRRRVKVARDAAVGAPQKVLQRMACVLQVRSRDPWIASMVESLVDLTPARKAGSFFHGALLTKACGH